MVALVAGVAWLVAQSAGLSGALAGGSLALVVLFVSTSIVNTVAGIMPGASLLIALLTFFLQVLLLAFVVVAINDADLSGEEFSRTWFAAGVGAVTMTWITAHVWLYTRLRIPAYDLTRSHRPGGES